MIALILLLMLKDRCGESSVRLVKRDDVVERNLVGERSMGPWGEGWAVFGTGRRWPNVQHADPALVPTGETPREHTPSDRKCMCLPSLAVVSDANIN